jgi:hypothetical protein
MVVMSARVWEENRQLERPTERPLRPQGAAKQALDPPNHDALSPHLLRQGLIPKQHLGTIPDDSAQISKTGGNNYVLVLS